MSPRVTVAIVSETHDMRPFAERWQALHPTHELRLVDDLGDLKAIDVAVCWFPPPGLLRTLPNLQLIQSVGAGIEHFSTDPSFPYHIPTFRIIDPEMAAGMAAYVAWAVISAHRGFERYADAQRTRTWAQAVVPDSRNHEVGILGLGELGLRCATTLASLGYRVSGWSRSVKADLPSPLDCYVGAAGLPRFLSRCQTLVCLLPLTPETHGLLSARLFDQLPDGAHLINVGRGDHLVEDDLLAALCSGKISQATLDTFSVEPLPVDHPFWKHPNVRITPHAATRTSIEVVAAQLLENLDDLQNGIRSRRQVQWARGY